MKTTVIQVQEVQKEIGISYAAIQLSSHHTYSVIASNGDKLEIETIKRADGMATFMVFENGGVRFTKPVMVLENKKG
jgi:hypothetical protein